MRHPLCLHHATSLGLIALISLAAGPSQAYDVAERQIIGFSEDGSRFAFEEFGTTEAEGENVYTNIYVIDTRTDEWVRGSPIRHREGWSPDDAPQQAVIVKARAHAKEKGRDLLKGLSFQGKPLVVNLPTERSADPHKVEFCYDMQGCQKVELLLEEIPLPASTPFNDPVLEKEAQGQTRGFRLVLEDSSSASGTSSAPVRRVLHEDKELPKARGQALGYRIVDVIHYATDKANVLAVTVMVYERGWEGQDGRYLAVTTQLPRP